MPRSLSGIVVLALCALSAEASAQTLDRSFAPVSVQASAAGARFIGTVTDEAGITVGGVSILALGTSFAVATTDAVGRFNLFLPFGDYIVRAVHEGYVSTYREPVRVQASATIERKIKLIRTESYAVDSAVAAAVLPAPVEDDHAHSDTAWRLRHLSRTVLRDVATVPDWRDASERVFQSAAPHVALAASDFNGQVNFLTTSSRAASGGALADALPRGVAYAVLGAPALGGNWSVRGAVASGSPSAWTLLGEYSGERGQRHLVRAGASYSAQTAVAAGGAALSAAAPNSRSVGGVYAFDRWHVRSGFDLEYGARFDRYDYLDSPSLASPEIGARVALASHTFFAASSSRRQVAPGADQFLPPAAAGPWLPPERTFSALMPGTPGAALMPEHVRHHEIGLDHDFGGDRSLSVRWISESTADQIATLFGLDSAREVGHYYVTSPGSVDLEGWSVRFSGQIGPHVRGHVGYVAANAEWRGPAMTPALRRDAAGLAARGFERMHDLQSSLEAVVPQTATRILVAYRIDSLFSGATRAGAPGAGARFNFEVRQTLPYKPIPGSELNLLLAVRTLLRDVGDAGSFYDELLTVAPPMRVTVGLQMGF